MDPYMDHRLPLSQGSDPTGIVMDLARKQKLTDEVHALQDRNKSLRRQVDRIGESALRAGRQGARNPGVC